MNKDNEQREISPKGILMNIDPKSETQKPVCAKCGGKGYYQVGYSITSQAVCECQRFSNTTLDAQEWNFNQFKALQSENQRLTEENSELHLKAAELHSLRMSILESPLKGFFPEKEISFHDKVLFAIHDIQHRKLLAWDQMQEVNKNLKTESERLKKINEELVKATRDYFEIDTMNCGTQEEVNILMTKQLRLRNKIESLIQTQQKGSVTPKSEIE